MPTISLPQQLALAKGARFTECQREYAPAARTALQRALQTKDDPSSALWELGQRLVKEVLSNLYANPRPITESGCGLTARAPTRHCLMSSARHSRRRPTR